MRSASLLAALAGAVALFPAAAAADSSAPSAMDFSQPVPSSEQMRQPTPTAMRITARRGGYGIEGPVLYRSDTATAPHRFDLVGVAGETHALEFRARREGGSWSRWAETDNGDPVYTGGTDEVQLRSRGVPIEGRLHFIRLDQGSKDAAPAEPTAARASRGAARKPARRGPPEPDYVTREEWGANARSGGCPPRTTPALGRIKAGAVHHTVNLNTYSEAEAPGIVLGICRFHRYANGWNDIGYNALVDRFGNLYEGRAGGMARPIMGAHAEGVNSQTTGIASIGDHQTKAGTSTERRTIVRFLAWKFGLAGIKATGSTRLLSTGGATARADAGDRVTVKPVFSHSDTNVTECAGSALRAQIPQIRRAVQRRLDQFAGADPVDPVDPVDPGGVTPGS